jgi:hypothetical protein
MGQGFRAELLGFDQDDRFGAAREKWLGGHDPENVCSAIEAVFGVVNLPMRQRSCDDDSASDRNVEPIGKSEGQLLGRSSGVFQDSQDIDLQKISLFLGSSRSDLNGKTEILPRAGIANAFENDVRLIGFQRLKRRRI